MTTNNASAALSIRGAATAEELCRNLRGTWNGTKGKARCPFHPDKDPSLDIKVGTKRNILAYCQVCGSIFDRLKQEGYIAQPASPKHKHAPSQIDEAHENYARLRDALLILRVAGGYRPGRPLKEAYGPPGERPSAYFAARGITKCPSLARVIPASEAKRLLSHRPDREGERLLPKNVPLMALPIEGRTGLQGVHTTVLSLRGTGKLNGDARRIHGIKKGGYIRLWKGKLDPKLPLLVGEGVETTCAAMQIAGIEQGVAAIDAGNFASVVLPDCSEVIVCGDNDKHGKGQKAATELAERLARQGIKARVAIAPRIKGREKSDWNDAVQSNPDLEKLRRKITKAPIAEAGTSTREGSGYARTMEDIMQLEIAPRPCLLDPWVKARSSGQIHAPRGAGKTRFAMSAAYALASGTSFLDWSVERPVRVLYVDAELDLAELKERLEALGPKAKNLRVLSFDDLFNQGVALPDLGKPEGRQFFDREFEAFQPDVVFLDSITFLAKVAENEAEAWDPIAEWIVKHRRLGRTIVFIHHQGRSGKARGTSKREDSIEVSIALKPRDDIAGDDGSVFELVFDKHRGFYGKDAAPRIVRFSSANGQIEWTCETKQENTKTRVAELLAAGYKQADIAKELGITRGYVSQIASKLKNPMGK